MDSIPTAGMVRSLNKNLTF